MCRFAAYIGTEDLAVSTLLYDMPTSLERLAYAPRELLSGHVNVDGTGAAWWPAGSETPLRYVTEKPPWADPNLPGLAPTFRGSPVIAAVRSATPGLPFGPDNVSPFTLDDLAGVHNGWIGGFRHGVGRTLLGRLSDEKFARLSVMNDSLALFLLVGQYRDQDMNDELSSAVTAVIGDIAKTVVAAGEAATLNLVVGSGSEIVAARTSVSTEVNSLYYRSGPSGSWLASEPLDDTAEWLPMPEHSVAVLNGDGIETIALDHEGMTS